MEIEYKGIVYIVTIDENHIEVSYKNVADCSKFDFDPDAVKKVKEVKEELAKLILKKIMFWI